MKITVLNENTCKTGLPCEHGLSLFIETQGHKILFDAGQTDIFARNAQTLGIDLTQADIAVLSHGHYDHGGGLETFFGINKTAPVYISRHAFENYYNGEKYIGINSSIKDNSRVILTCGKTAIGEGLTLYPAEEVREVFALPESGLTVMRGAEKVPDDFRHEQYLMIEEGGKRILISGCSHKGIVSIAARFRPDVLIGGFHLSKITDETTLADCAEHLRFYGTEYYTCHCTGVPQYEYLSNITGKIHYISTGETVII